MRLLVGTKVFIKHTGEYATVVPTGKKIPHDEIDVMIHPSGSVRTLPVRAIEVVL